MMPNHAIALVAVEGGSFMLSRLLTVPNLLRFAVAVSTGGCCCNSLVVLVVVVSTFGHVSVGPSVGAA